MNEQRQMPFVLFYSNKKGFTKSVRNIIVLQIVVLKMELASLIRILEIGL